MYYSIAPAPAEQPAEKTKNIQNVIDSMGAGCMGVMGGWSNTNRYIKKTHIFFFSSSTSFSFSFYFIVFI